MAKSLTEMIEADNAAASDGKTASVEAVAEMEPEVESTDTASIADDTEEASEDATEEKGKDADADYSVRDFLKDINGEESAATLANFKTDEDAARAWWEAQKLIGRRHEDSEVVKYLRANGIGAEEIQRLISERGQQKPSGDSDGTLGKEWDPAWIQVNKKGEWIPTAKAPSDIEQRMDRYRAQLAEAMTDPSKLADFLRPHLAKDIEAKTSEAKAEAEQRFAQQEQQREFHTWTEHKRKLLFNEGSDELTPLGKMVNDRMQSGKISRNLSWVEQAEDALDWAVAKSQPVPVRKIVPQGAKRQASPASGTPHKLSDSEFFKKYGTDLTAFVAFKATGELPG